VRVALGARVVDIARMLWAETMILSATGGALGLVISWWALRAFVRLGSTDIPRLDEVGLDWRVLGFAAVLMLTIAGVLALAPLWQLSRHPAAPGVPQRDHGSTRRGAVLRYAVILGETALTSVLLLGSLVLIRSFERLQDVDPGFAIDDRVIARIALPRSTYRTPEALMRFADRLSAELMTIPGVQSVGGVNVAPLSGVLATVDLGIEGKPPRDPRDLPTANYRIVTTAYLSTLGVPLLRGRGLAETDTATSVPVALINEHVASTLFPNDDPIGKRILVNDNTGGHRPLEVVGVIANVRQAALDGPPSFDVYVPMRQMHPDLVQWVANNQFWAIKASGNTADVLSGVRRALPAVDSTVGLAHVRPLAEYVDAALGQRRFATTLSSALASIAVVLVVVGLYGVMAYSVAQRTREIGLRAAVGASRLSIWWLIAGSALRMLGTGAVAGLLLAAAALRPLQAVLFQTDLFDPALVATVIGGLLAVGIGAATIPALRATRIDPIIALRE